MHSIRASGAGLRPADVLKPNHIHSYVNRYFGFRTNVHGQLAALGYFSSRNRCNNAATVGAALRLRSRQKANNRVNRWVECFGHDEHQNQDDDEDNR